jgi:hypothetical protein
MTLSIKILPNRMLRPWFYMDIKGENLQSIKQLSYVNMLMFQNDASYTCLYYAWPRTQ